MEHRQANNNTIEQQAAGNTGNRELPVDNTVTRISYKSAKQRAIADHQAGKIEQAMRGYKACLKINNQDVAAWSNLGAALRKQQHYQSAVNCYRRALELAPDDLAATGNLANVLKDLHRLDEALALHQQLIARQPDDVQTLTNHACALRDAGQFEQALEQLDKAKAIEPDNPQLEWERAQCLLSLGRYTEGWHAYEARWLTGDLPVKQFAFPRWQGEPLTDKHLLLYSEQGYGDTILVARYVPLIKEQGATITLQCKPELHRLFANLGVDNLVAGDHSATASAENDEYDYHCPLMSLMQVFDTQLESIPPVAPLAVPEAAREKFAFIKNQHTGCLKVGIVWSGSVTFADNDNRSVSLERFLPLAEIPGVRLYSLQKGPRAKELYDSGADAVIEDIGRLCDDFADTAAAIENLDVIVMTDSSVVHLAGSMGKPVINLLQKMAYWVYAVDDEETAWYPKMELIKQKEIGQWDSGFQQVSEWLIKRCDL